MLMRGGVVPLVKITNEQTDGNNIKIIVNHSEIGFKQKYSDKITSFSLQDKSQHMENLPYLQTFKRYYWYCSILIKIESN
jgi:hypothetical protein